MSKKKAEKKDWPREVENACRDAVSNIPGFDDKSIPELEWCKAVSEGLSGYLLGIDMRIQELESDE